MTDARFPERWLNDRRVLRLSDPGFRLYVTALAWSVSNRTDGFIDKDDLSLMPRVDTGHVTELEETSLWSRDADRWLIVDFAGTQTSSTQLAGLDVKRMQDRERAKNYRDRKKSSRDSSRDDKGQARPGQENLDEGEVFRKPSHDVPKGYEPEIVQSVRAKVAVRANAANGASKTAGDWPEVASIPGDDSVSPREPSPKGSRKGSPIPSDDAAVDPVWAQLGPLYDA